ncbi:hypothetical protein [Pseudacidovorax intermedius]|uniref:Uncharacterized protein n=1 Tax=Pseudacidovorax intermedius TaxID=433924 RepID=A0A147GWW2_9BURK|nr:hypothetical protein [Pseudacidovorax intermedius]KTT21872.1 hypothetical protein NS331_10935 [Pseudacidovorax intermedius]
MKKAWVIVRPVIGYEDSLEVVAAALTKGEADAAARRVNAFFHSLQKRLARMPDPFEDGISDEEHSDRWDRRHKAITGARWPFGYSFESDLGQSGDVAIVKAVPFVTGGAR